MARLTLILTILTTVLGLLGGFSWIYSEFKAMRERRRLTGRWLLLTLLLLPNTALAVVPTPFIHYKFDEGTGTNVNDEIGSNDATLTNGPTWVSGKTGNAVRLNSATDFVAIPYGSGVNPSTQSITVCLWAKPDAGDENPSGVTPIFSTNSIGTNQRFQIARAHAGFYGTYDLGIQDKSPGGGYGYPATHTSSWERVCHVANAATDTARIFINGVASLGTFGGGTYTSFSLAGNFRVGSDDATPEKTSVDDLKIWQVALTDAEVWEEYNAYGPNLSPWEGHMTYHGNQWCTQAKTYTLSTPFDEISYYDGIAVYQQIKNYTGDATAWAPCVNAMRLIYRDTFVIPNSGNVPGYWNFTRGLTLDFAQNGDTISKNAVNLLASNGVFCDATAMASSNQDSPQRSREVAYCTRAYLYGRSLGYGPYTTVLANGLAHLHSQYQQWFVTKTFRCGVAPLEACDPAVAQDKWYAQPFMLAINNETMIQRYNEISDPTERAQIIADVKMACDWMWTYAWYATHSGNSNYHYALYYDLYSNDGNPPYSVTTGSNPADLSLLIAHSFQWLYQVGQGSAYKDHAVEIFNGGVARASLDSSSKIFNQNYLWSFDYVAALDATPAPTPPPATRFYLRFAEVAAVLVSLAKMPLMLPLLRSMLLCWAQFKRFYWVTRYHYAVRRWLRAAPIMVERR